MIDRRAVAAERGVDAPNALRRGLLRFGSDVRSKDVALFGQRPFASAD